MLWGFQLIVCTLPRTLFWSKYNLPDAFIIRRFVLLVSRKMFKVVCFRPFGRLDHVGFLPDLAIPVVVSFLSTVVTGCSWLVVLYFKFETIPFVPWTVPTVMAIFVALMYHKLFCIAWYRLPCLFCQWWGHLRALQFVRKFCHIAHSAVSNSFNCRFFRSFSISINLLSILSKTTYIILLR